MSQVLELKQRRARLIEEMRQLLHRAKQAAESGQSPRECEEAFDKAEADERDLTAQINRLERLEQLERDAAQRFLEDNGAAIPAENQMEYRQAFAEWFRYGHRAAPEALRLLEKRGTSDQVVGTPSLGGYLVPQEFMQEIIRTMKDYSGIAAAARIMYTDSGAPLLIPTENDVSTVAQLVAEATTFSIQDITFGQLALSAYKYATAAKFSWELMQDSAFDLAQELPIIFGPRFGRAMNAACTTGTGTGQPQGVVTAAPEGKEAASHTAITFSEIMDLLHSVDPAYRASPQCGFMLHDSVLAVIKKLQLGSGDATPLWLPSVREGEPDRILGYRYWINQAMESTLGINKKIMLFGDFSKFLIRIAKDVTIQRLNETYAMSGLVGFVAHMRFDSKLLDTGAVKHLVTKKT